MWTFEILHNFHPTAIDKEYNTHGETRTAYRVLEGKLEGKRPLGRPRRRWGNKIKMDLREVGWGDLDRIDLAEDRDQ
jgi:hypothetical protein